MRRIEAVTGLAALAYAYERDDLLHAAAEAVKSSVKDLPSRVKALSEERRKLEKELVEMRQKAASGTTQSETVNGVAFVGQVLTDVPAKELKGIADGLKKQVGSGVVALACAANGKVSVIVGVTEDLTDRFNAVDLVRAAAVAVGGKGGGGRPDMAQAGGADDTKIQDALEAVKKCLQA